jgi:hypothetical protein
MVYSPEMVTLLQQLRHRVFAEFGTRIRLADPELLSVLGELGKRSRDPFTQKTVVEIMALAEIPFHLKSAGKSADNKKTEGRLPTQVTYRGIKISRDENVPSTKSQSSTDPQVIRQMYRGQVVNK